MSEFGHKRTCGLHLTLDLDGLESVMFVTL